MIKSSFGLFFQLRSTSTKLHCLL